MGEPAPPPPRRDGRPVAAALAWDDVAIFDAIAQAGSLSLAAARLGLSEATVARRLRGFERSLGLTLFDRGPNRLLPTPAGTRLAAEARKVGAAMAAFSGCAAAERPNDGGPVRVTATTSLSLWLTTHATAVSQAAGGVELVIISTRQRLDLARGEAEIALRMRRMPEEPGHFGQRVGLLAQALYVRNDVDPETAPIVSVSVETSSRIDEHTRRYAAGRPIAARVGDSAARYESVRSAGAVAMVPCFIADADPMLRRLAPPPEETADAIYLVTHEVSRRRPAVAAVLAALRNLFRHERAKLAGEIATFR